MVKGADHGRIEVAGLVLVVANILLVAVWHLERNLLLRFSKGRHKVKDYTLLLASHSPKRYHMK